MSSSFIASLAVARMLLFIIITISSSSSSNNSALATPLPSMTTRDVSVIPSTGGKYYLVNTWSTDYLQRRFGPGPKAQIPLRATFDLVPMLNQQQQQQQQQQSGDSDSSTSSNRTTTTTAMIAAMMANNSTLTVTTPPPAVVAPSPLTFVQYMSPTNLSQIEVLGRVVMTFYNATPTTTTTTMMTEGITEEEEEEDRKLPWKILLAYQQVASGGGLRMTGGTCYLLPGVSDPRACDSASWYVDGLFGGKLTQGSPSSNDG